MKLLIALLFSLMLPIAGIAQQLDWAAAIGGVYGDVAVSVATDDQGNVYSLGVFNGTIDFDPGPATHLMTPDNGSDVYIQKLDSAGNFVWSVRIGAFGADEASEILIDGSNQLWIFAKFGVSGVDLDPGAGTFFLPGTSAYDLVAIRLDTAGGFLGAWGLGPGSNSSLNLRNVTLDVNNDLLITGGHTGTTDFDPGSGTSSYTTNASFYIAKYSSMGAFQWVKFMEVPPMGGEVYGLSTDNQGSIFWTGNVGGAMDFDPGPGVFTFTTQPIRYGFLAKYDSGGNFLWADMFTGNNQTIPMAVAVQSNGTIHAVGSFEMTVDFDPGPGTYLLTSPNNDYQAFRLRLNASGQFIDVLSLGGSGWEWMSHVEIDGAGNQYVMGSYEGNVDLDPTSGDYFTNETNPNQTGTFLHGYDANGTFQWARVVLHKNYAEDLHVPASGTQHIAGRFIGTDDANPGSAIHNIVCNGNVDAYVIKWKHCTPTDSMIEVKGCTLVTVNNMQYSTSGTYLQTLTNSNGCDSLLTVQVTIGTVPSAATVNISGCDQVFLNGQWFNSTGTFQQILVNAVGCDSVLTVIADIPQSTDTTINASVCDSLQLNGQTYTATGIYNQYLTNVAGCDSTIRISVYVSHSSVDTTITQAGDTLTANATNATFQWLDCNNGFAQLPNQTGASLVPSQTGMYAVLITQNSCLDTSACYPITIVSLPEAVVSEPISVSPNPSSGLFELRYQSDRPELLRMWVTNALGQTLHLQSGHANEPILLDLSDLASGCYILNVVSPHATFQRRLIVE
ncbi:MAG: T9SS type A sorting domain-containing protein [Bacteroidia bacterium]